MLRMLGRAAASSRGPCAPFGLPAALEGGLALDGARERANRRAVGAV